MLVGLAQYRLTVRHLGSAGAAPASTPAERRAGWRWVLAALALLASAVAGLWTGAYAVSAARLADVLGDVMVLLGIGFFGYVLLFGKLNPVERRHVAVLIVFFLCACVFWAGYEQAGSTLNLFARDLTDRSAFGSYFSAHEHPATWYQSVESICVVLLAPVFAWVWIALGRRNLNPSAPVKLSLGLMQLGAGYAVMMLAAQLIIHNGGKAGPQWLLLTYLLHTTGELCLSPIGLSNTTKLAPKRFAGQMMGTWFLGTALGNLAAGEIGGRLGTDVATMPDAFLRMTLVGVMSGLVVLALSPLIRRWMGGVR
jgi:POT family proton-dependent oligopeptide transporter